MKAKYICEPVFADDILLMSDCQFKAQKLLMSVESVAKKVGLNINVPMTEYTLVGNLWESTEPFEIRLESGVLKRVQILMIHCMECIFSTGKDMEVYFYF